MLGMLLLPLLVQYASAWRPAEDLEGAAAAAGAHLEPEGVGSASAALLEEQQQQQQQQSAAAAKSEESSGRSLTAAGPKDPEVVKLAVKRVWKAIVGRGADASGGGGLELEGCNCRVNPLLQLNQELAPVRAMWKEENSYDFMSELTPEEQAAKLVGKFRKLQAVTEGSRSGSDIFVSDHKQLFLKSEGKAELKALQKTRAGGATFLQEYVERVTSRDHCTRSTLMRYLAVFTVTCTKPRLGRWGTITDEAVWMLFANVVPHEEVPAPLHQFDLKASRDMGDCHAKNWNGDIESGAQGYIGDFLALYGEAFADAECTPAQVVDFDPAGSRKVCFLRALHLDFRLLGRYHLIDYSLYVFVTYFEPVRDNLLLQHHNNMLRVELFGSDLLITVGTIDLLKDWDASAGVRIQSRLGLKKGLPIPGLATTLYGQDKYQGYPYYLFCTSVDIFDPPCAGMRKLQVLAQCKDGDNLDIFYPQERRQKSTEETQLMDYVFEGDYCHLVNSCEAMLRKPFAVHNLDICEEQACKVFGNDRCAEYVLPGEEVFRTGTWRQWTLPWLNIGLSHKKFDAQGAFHRITHQISRVTGQQRPRGKTTNDLESEQHLLDDSTEVDDTSSDNPLSNLPKLPHSKSFTGPAP